MGTKEEHLKKITDCGIVAIVRTHSAADAVNIVRAIVKGGIKAVEITMSVPGALDAIAEISAELKDEAVIGAGTVTDPETAAKVIERGAEYVISPIMNIEIIKVVLALGKIAIPGAFTPTEIHAAWTAGADIVKIFPASIGGPGYLKDLRGPFPYLKLMPTGGVNLNNIAAYLQAGSVAVGVGGNLIDKKAVAEGRFEVITETARRYAEAVQKGRAGG